VVASEIPGAVILPRNVNGHRERTLERQRRTNQDAPDRHQIALRKRTVVPLNEPIDDVRLARGLDLDAPVALNRSDFLHQPGTADQQILDGVVDGIDFGADFVESSFSAHLPFRNALVWRTAVPLSTIVHS
jgi:hypothetical protein